MTKSTFATHFCKVRNFCRIFTGQNKKQLLQIKIKSCSVCQKVLQNVQQPFLMLNFRIFILQQVRI